MYDMQDNGINTNWHPNTWLQFMFLASRTELIQLVRLRCYGLTSIHEITAWILSLDEIYWRCTVLTAGSVLYWRCMALTVMLCDFRWIYISTHSYMCTLCSLVRMIYPRKEYAYQFSLASHPEHFVVRWCEWLKIAWRVFLHRVVW